LQAQQPSPSPSQELAATYDPAAPPPVFALRALERVDNPAPAPAPGVFAPQALDPDGGDETLGDTSRVAPGRVGGVAAVGPLAGDDTILRSRLTDVPTSLTPPERSSAWRRVLAVAAGVLAVGGVAAGAIVLGGGSDGGGDPEPTAPSETAGDPAGGPAERFAPTEYTVDDHGDSVDLHWVDRTEGQASYLVIVFRDRIEEPAEQTVQVDAGATDVTVRNLDPEAPYCFRLFTVGTDEAGDRYRAAVDQQVRGCEVESPAANAARTGATPSSTEPPASSTTTEDPATATEKP
jgi:hypothetical protein